MPLCRRLSACLGASAVLLGAFGAHALKADLVAKGTLDVWQTAVFWHAIHAVALLALSNAVMTRKVRVTAWLFAVGVLVFSGSLYALAWTGVKGLGAITPAGGVALVTGWIILFCDSARPSDPT